MATTPLLSIGMIFKNEERCLERCLKSLEPLRKAIPCELVMADTGSEDHSRAIAERYADEVFDFAWIDDFAAARNAVMDRCKGKWYMSVDCDEWLDADIVELVSFFKGKKKVDFAFMVVRSYFSAELEKGEVYSDFYGLRIMRMATGERYQGIIHESWRYSGSFECLPRTILHHDGYFFASPEAEKEKKQRNLKLLRQKLEQDPEDLRSLTQYIESGSIDPELMQHIRAAVALVQKKASRWQIYGPAILRHAAEAARVWEMPELDEWVDLAEKTFPDAIYTQIDLNYTVFMAAHDAEEWDRAIRYGEGYRKGYRTLQPGDQFEKNKHEIVRSTLKFNGPNHRRTVLTGLANAYFQVGKPEKTLALLAELDAEKFNMEQTRNTMVLLCQMHAQTQQNVAPALIAFYDQISRDDGNEEKRSERLAAFDTIAAIAFTEDYREEEKEHDGYHRPAYTAFQALADKCEVGRAAKLMMTIAREEMRPVLASVENWQALPIEALEYALREDVAFPLEEKPLNGEVMDGLAARMTHGENTALQIALTLPENAQKYPNLQSLYWAKSLVLASLRTFNWEMCKDDDPISKFAGSEKEQKKPEKHRVFSEKGLALIRRFAQIESILLPLLYTPLALAEENAALLPPIHRWGVYCTRALNALDAGRPQEYLAILRRGLAACPGEKDIIQFLLDRFREDTRPEASPELLALAEKVRTILAAYGPADPAVAALKASPAYRQVAWIIEGEAGRPAQPAQPAYPPVKKPVRAVFFAELGEKWDAMQSVYEFMRADPRFDPVVVRTPVFRAVQRNGRQEQETIYRDFLTPMGIPSLGYDAYDIAADRPDLAFISQPYESAALPQFWPENIAKHTRLIYLPYYLPYTVAGHDDIISMAQMPVHRFAWKVACSGKKHCAFYCRHAENKGANALVAGLPKTDPIVAARQKPPSLPHGWEALNGKTVFLWNSWYSMDASSLRYFDVLMEWFNAHKDCALIWRPHPMCDTVTKLYYPDQYPAWQEMLRRAEAAENVIVDREVSFLAAFTASHAMVSDTSSMLPQYLLFDKPTLWTRSRLTGEEFVDCRWMEQAGREEDILAFLERVRNHEDRNAALRTAIRKRDLPLADGHCGERLCEAVWNALQEEGRA